MQISVLGFMSFIIMALVFMGKKVTLKERLAVQASFNLVNIKGMVSLVKDIFIFTFALEVVMIIAIFIRLYMIDSDGALTSFFNSVFLTVASFGNAGFVSASKDMLRVYMTDPFINIVMSILIFIGGLGFVVWKEAYEFIKYKFSNNKDEKHFIKFSLHFKLSIMISLILIISGSVFFFIYEYNNYETLKSMTFFDKMIHSLSHSVNSRSAGFSIFDQYKITDMSKFITIILMFIGASSAGSGGGIKTSTVGIIIFSVVSSIQGRNGVRVFNRSISFELLQKALAIIVMFFLLNIFTVMMLSLTEHLPGYDLTDILFEVISTTYNTGFSVGIIAQLSDVGKVILILCMLIGKIGPMTMVFALTVKLNKNCNNIKYPEEKVLIG
jgi:trk system potassium uptake protein TrkH